MSRCPCELLGPRLQRPAHEIHEAVEERLRRMGELVPRYVRALRAGPRPDRTRDALLERTRDRLRALHRNDADLLPRQPTSSAPSSDRARIRELLQPPRGHDEQ